MGEQKLKKEENIALPVLAKELTPAEVRRRVGDAYARILNRVKQELEPEASAYSRRMRVASKDLHSLASLTDEAPSHLTVSWDFSYEYRFRRGSDPRPYHKRLDRVKSVSDIAQIADEARRNGVEFSFTFNTLEATPNVSYLFSARDDVVSGVSSALEEGFKGGIQRAYTFNIPNPQLARAFSQSFEAELGISHPSPAPKEPIPFDDARIARGRLPLRVIQDGQRIEIEWASWIAPGTRDLGEIVPARKGG